ncbi:hypothetical protein ACJX0J_030128, partial [Zea mays]
IIYDKVTNRSRGFAFVTMATAEEAAKAIQMFDGALLGGRTARVNYPEVPRGGERRTVTMSGRRRDDGTYKIYAGNLGWGVRADTLRNVFEGRAGLLDARVIFERETGRSRGFGFVSFSTAEDAQAALESLDGVGHVLVDKYMEMPTDPMLIALRQCEYMNCDLLDPIDLTVAVANMLLAEFQTRPYFLIHNKSDESRNILQFKVKKVNTFVRNDKTENTFFIRLL